jgi:hypothetical protein
MLIPQAREKHLWPVSVVALIDLRFFASLRMTFWLAVQTGFTH